MRAPRFVAAFAILLAVGCTPAAAVGGPVSTERVDLPRSYLFAPADITVKAGATVTWTNSDQFTHGVELLAPAKLDLGTIKPGESVSYRFATAGTYAYDCPFHPRNMKGTVTVR